jgi:hypothetical protein
MLPSLKSFSRTLGGRLFPDFSGGNRAVTEPGFSHEMRAGAHEMRQD